MSFLIQQVRTLIMGTYRARGPEVFWKKLEDCVPLYSSPIVSFRFIRLLISFLLVSYSNTFFFNSGDLETSDCFS